MNCAWEELLAVLPLWMRKYVDMQKNNSLREIRLRINSPPELVLCGNKLWLERDITKEDLDYTINAASRYSPWAAGSAANGYITIRGAHRIGLCGECVSHNGEITGIRNITSLCVRVSADYPGIAADLKHVSGSILIIGSPGWGKTTLLRDLIRQISRKENVCVVDERSELFPSESRKGESLDVLTGCDKKKGIPMLLRTMGPDSIAVDEITEPEDVHALLQAANCGVRLLATAHAASAADFRSRGVYKPLLENDVFDTLVVLKRNSSYTIERMGKWNTDGWVHS